MVAIDSHKLVEKVKEVVGSRQLIHAVILSAFALVGLVATAAFLYAAVECGITTNKETGEKRWQCGRGLAAEALAEGDKAAIGALAAKISVVVVVTFTVFFTSGIALWVSLRRCSNKNKPVVIFDVESYPAIKVQTRAVPSDDLKKGLVKQANVSATSDVTEEEQQLTKHEMA